MKKTKKVNKKKSKNKRYVNYMYPSILFGLMLALFNYVFLICALYEPNCSGIYMKLFDNVVLNVLINRRCRWDGCCHRYHRHPGCQDRSSWDRCS